jgi:hypothetical protein
MVEAFMRVYDANGDGVVQISEFTDVLCDLISGIMYLAADVLDDLVQKYLLQGPLTSAASLFFDELVRVTSSDPVRVQDIVEALAGAIEALGASGAAEAAEAAKSKAEPAWLWMTEVWKEHASEIDRLMDQLQAMAKDGPLQKEACLSLAADSLCGILERVFTPDGVSGGAGLMLQLANSSLERTTAGLAQVPEEAVGEVVPGALAALHGFLRGGGAARLLAALFDLLDVDNDGAVSPAEAARCRGRRAQGGERPRGAGRAPRVPRADRRRRRRVALARGGRRDPPIYTDLHLIHT